MDFKFKPNTLYKVSFRRTYRPADNGVIIGSFLREMKWGCEFGHAMDVELERVTSGELNLERDSIFRVEPTTETELALWRTLAYEMMQSIIKLQGSDPCYEDVSKVTNYKIMERKFRREPLNYAKVWENSIKGMTEYLEKNNLESMILGISGGIDSTVSAAICCEVYKRTGKKLFGLSMPSATNENDEVTTADLVLKEFCTFGWTHNINEEFEVVYAAMMNRERTPIADGNIKARLRMIHLFDLSAAHRGIVIDTDNLPEHHLGFFSVFGDHGSIGFLSGLWKHEIYEFAEWMFQNKYPDSVALKKSIALIPTDGNGVMAGGDMAQIAPGFTYNEVDKILYDYLTGIEDGIPEDFIIEKLSYDFPKETVEKVIKRHKNSEFKRRYIPLVIDPETGYVLQNDWRPL